MRGHFGAVVETINDSGASVVAVDLPSGLSADNGAVAGPAVVADLTVTFAAPKLCHTFPPACELIGELSVVDIGIPEAAIDAVESALELITPEECAFVLKAGKLAKWSLITICPVYFRPQQEVFVKPTTVKGVIAHFELDELQYRPQPYW